MRELSKMPFELWEYNITTGQTKKHSSFELRSDADKMKRAMEAHKPSSVFTVTAVWTH